MNDSPRMAWLREPLLHIIVLGAMLFALDHYLVARADDPRVIVVGADVDKTAIEMFRTRRGRDPDAKEMAALRKVWLSNEMLFREGLALQLDRGDDAIRDRVIFKALSVVEASIILPKIDDTALEAWFEAHRDKYDEPPRFDFEEASLDTENTEQAVRAFAKALNRGLPGDAKADLRVFKGRPRSDLDISYGKDFAPLLESFKPGEWHAVKAQDRWRAIRLSKFTPGKSVTFAMYRNVVLQDWKDAVGAEQRSAAIDALAKKYKIRYEGKAP